MTVADFTFPQNGDADYSENFGTWLGRSNITNYVEEGMDFTVDYATPEATISDGKAFVKIPEKTISDNNETRLTLDYAIIKASTTISLSDGNVNYIYLNPNITTNDSPTYNSYTNEGNAGSNSLKIGEIDTTNDTVTEFNRLPDASFDVSTTSSVLNIPVYDEISNAPSGEGNLIWITGGGSDDQGLYSDTGSGYDVTGVDTITALEDVIGITSLIEGSSGDRPSAGVEGRIFFDTTNNRIEYDNGASWDILGQNAGTIDSSDLGFNTATQSELDSHEGDLEAHYTLIGGDHISVTYDTANDQVTVIGDGDATTYKGNDIDSDGDGIVNEADQALSFEVRTSDPTSPSGGRAWIRSDL